MVTRADQCERGEGALQSRRVAQCAVLLLAITACTPVLPEEPDSGPVVSDAGPIDSGPIDSGQYPGIDAGDDAGIDAGPTCGPELIECDGTCVDLDTATDHCGECNNACPAPAGTVPTCAAGSCGVECATGREDCDGDPTNGCEVDVEGDPLHCGGCGLMCDAGRTCRGGRCRPDPQWARTFGSVDRDIARAVAVDSDGNIYVTGSFYGSVSFGGDVLTGTSTHVFVASYAHDGAHRWSMHAGGPGGSTVGSGIAVDGAGNVYVTGSFGTSSLSFGGPTLVADGPSDIFVASFTSTGAHRWSRRGGGTLGDSARRIAVDPAGNIYVSGHFGGTASFGGAELVSAGGLDAFVASYTSSGAHRWSLRGGGTGNDVPLGIAADASGNAFVVGHFAGTASFGGASLTSAGGSDVFVASFSTTGEHRWSIRAGGTAFDSATAVAVDDAGEVYVAGHFEVAGDFGGAPLASAGGSDVWVGAFTASGVHRWSLRGGGSNSDYAFDLAVDPSGRVHVAGDFGSDTASFGGPPLVDAGVFLATYARADGAHLTSIRLDGGGFDEGGVGTGSSALCTVGAFAGNFSFAGETFIAAGDAEGFIACFEP